MSSIVDSDSVVRDIDWSSATEVLSLRGFAEQVGDAFQRCADVPSHTELVLISGPSGMGKTSLALGVKARVSASGGYMITGKFDQVERGLQGASSYGPYVEAFSEYIETALKAGDEQVESVKRILEECLDLTELQVLRDMMPGLNRILGAVQTVASATERSSVIKGPDAESRFIRIFGLFVRAICSLGCPVVLFLDDIQWANQSEINLLLSLARLDKEAPMSCFMLLCTIRSDEVSSEDPIFIGLEEMQKQSVTVNKINVASLNEDEVSHFLAVAMHLSTIEVTPLSRLVFERTDGNLLFVTMLIKALQEEGFLQQSGLGMWDSKSINRFTAAFPSVNQLIVRNIQQLPEHVQELLKVASCIGSTFSTSQLSPLGVVDSDELLTVLAMSATAGVVTVNNDLGTGHFVHDRIQKAVYTLVPTSERAALHLSIGRKLWKSTPRSQHDEYLLLIAQQVLRGVDLITDPFEKDDFAEMFYMAGQKAAISSAFVTAAAYLNMGIRLLGPRRWKDQYSLCLRLHNFAAEIEYYIGNLHRMDELVAAVFKKARSFEDKLSAHFTRIYSLGSRHETEKALDDGLEVLKELGETFPPVPNVVHIIVGSLRLNYSLRRKGVGNILDMPVMRDPKSLAVMRLMSVITPFAFYVRTPLSVLLTFRMIEHTLKHGLSDMASYAFASLSIVCVYADNLDQACRISELALQTLSHFNNQEWKARVIASLLSIHHPLKYPYRDALEPLKDAHRSGLVVGDLNFSMLNGSVYCAIAFSSGLPLPKLVEETTKYRALCKQYNQLAVMTAIGLQMQVCLNLMGLSDDPLVMTGAVMDEDEVVERLRVSNPIDLVRLYIFKLTLAVYMNDSAAAQKVRGQLRQFDKIKTIPCAVVAQLFDEGLTVARACSSCKKEIRHAKAIIRKLKKFADQAPCNFRQRVALVEAELATSQHQHDKAMQKYTIAMDHARQEGFIHEQALACERASYALYNRRKYAEARTYLDQACSLYEMWGAKAKLDQLATTVRDWKSQTGHDGDDN